MASNNTTSGRAFLIAAVAGVIGVCALGAATVFVGMWWDAESRLKRAQVDGEREAKRKDEKIRELAARVDQLQGRLGKQTPTDPDPTVSPAKAPSFDPQATREPKSAPNPTPEPKSDAKLEPKPGQGGPQVIESATAKLRTAKREEKIAEGLADLPKDGLEIKSTPAAGLVEHSLEAKGKEWVLKVAGKEACRFAHEKEKLTALFADYEKSPQRALAHGLVLVVKPSGSSKPLEVPLGEPLDLELSIKSVEKGVDRLKPGGTYEFVSGSKKDIESFTNALGWADDLVDVIEFEGTGDLMTKDGPDGGFAVVDKKTSRGVVLKREPVEKRKPVRYTCTHYALKDVKIPELKTLERAAIVSKPAKTHLQQLQDLKIKGGVMTPSDYEHVRKLLDQACDDLKQWASTRTDDKTKDLALAEAESLGKCLPSVEDCELRIDQFGKGFRLTLRKSRGDSAGIVVIDSLNR